MGSPVPQQSSEPSGKPAPSTPETLARVILRCRELATYLDGASAHLPARSETPFLYGQLDDVLQRLQHALRPLAREEAAPAERASGLLRLLSGKKREPAKKSEPRYDLEGNAWTIPVTELVGFLSHSAKSGLLWVTSSSETFVLEFARGSLVHATSNAPPVAFRLGEILLDEKMLEPVELARLIDGAKAADDLLGSYLVRSGRLKHSDLQRALAIQVQQLFHRLMDAENALYRFQEGAQLLKSHGLEVNITGLLLESARKKDEEREAADVAQKSSACSLAMAASQAGLGVLDEPPTESPPDGPQEPDAPLPGPAGDATGAAAQGQPPKEQARAESAG